MHQVQFDVSVNANAEIETVSDDTPSGWNYRTDSPTYSNESYLAIGNTDIQSVSFPDNGTFIIDGTDSNIRDAQRVFHISTLKKLLDPKLYEEFAIKVFENKLEDIDSYDDRY